MKLLQNILKLPKISKKLTKNQQKSEKINKIHKKKTKKKKKNKITNSFSYCTRIENKTTTTTYKIN